MFSDNGVVIRIEGISKHYQMGDTTVRALDGVDLSVNSGETVSYTHLTLPTSDLV